MFDAILPLKRYFEFTGRSRRREFWLWTIFSSVASIVVAFFVIAAEALMGFDISVYDPANANQASPTLSSDWLGILLFLATIIPSVSVLVRRLHEPNRSVKWLLVLAIPALGFLILLVFMCLSGTRGANRFGPDPRG